MATIKVMDAIEPGLVKVEVTDEELDERLYFTEEEARDLFNQLYDYFESKDREALAKWLTNDKRA